MTTDTFTALAEEFTAALAAPAGGRDEQQYLDDVMPRVEAIGARAVALINEHARRGTPGFVSTTAFVPVVRSLAAEHPEAFSARDYARTTTGLLNGSHAEACRLLAKMAGEGTASPVSEQANLVSGLDPFDTLRDEVEAAARSQTLERLDSAQLESRMQISESTRKRQEAEGLIGFTQQGPKHAKRYLWVNGRPLTRAEVLSLWSPNGSTRVSTGQQGPSPS